MESGGSNSAERLLDSWLRSEDARLTAARLVARYQLEIDASDLLHETWLRLSAAIHRGNSALSELSEPSEVAKYAYRAMDNLCRDFARTRRRRGELVVLDEVPALVPTTDGGFDSIEQQEFLGRLLYAVSSTIDGQPTCVGCAKGVAEAAALQAVHLLLAGDDATDSARPWIDQLLYRSLDIVDVDNAGRSPEARRQRKLRCGRCAREILTEALSVMGYGR